MAELIIAGITILEIGVFIKSWVAIKEEDPLKEIKRERPFQVLCKLKKLT